MASFNFSQTTNSISSELAWKLLFLPVTREACRPQNRSYLFLMDYLFSYCLFTFLKFITRLSNQNVMPSLWSLIRSEWNQPFELQRLKDPSPVLVSLTQDINIFSVFSCKQVMWCIYISTFFPTLLLLPEIPTDLLQNPGLKTFQFQADVTTACLKELHCLVTTPLFQE